MMPLLFQKLHSLFPRIQSYSPADCSVTGLAALARMHVALYNFSLSAGSRAVDGTYHLRYIHYVYNTCLKQTLSAVNLEERASLCDTLFTLVREPALIVADAEKEHACSSVADALITDYLLSTDIDERAEQLVFRCIAHLFYPSVDGMMDDEAFWGYRCRLSTWASEAVNCPDAWNALPPDVRLGRITLLHTYASMFGDVRCRLAARCAYRRVVPTVVEQVSGENPLQRLPLLCSLYEVVSQMDDEPDRRLSVRLSDAFSRLLPLCDKLDEPSLICLSYAVRSLCSLLLAGVDSVVPATA